MSACSPVGQDPMYRTSRLHRHLGLGRRSKAARCSIVPTVGSSDISVNRPLCAHASSPKRDPYSVAKAFSKLRKDKLNTESNRPAASFSGAFSSWYSSWNSPFFSRIRESGLGTLRHGNCNSFAVNCRDFAYLHSAQDYSDDEDEVDPAVKLSDVDRWQSRLRRFLHGDAMELVSRDVSDRKDFPKLGPLLKSLGLHGQMYSKTIVISKVPLPNYRPDLDPRRPQREVEIDGSVKDEVDSLLSRYLLQKEEQQEDDESREDDARGQDFDEGGSARKRSQDERRSRHVSRVEELINEERLQKRSLRLRDKQQSWEESPDGQKMMAIRQTLPSWTERENLLDAIAENQVLVVSGETGCGKTTQLPQYILESKIAAGEGASCNIICTQPRRISAISVAERVAAERGEDLGNSVGYQVRLEGKRSSYTNLLFCTSGILLRRLMNDPDLKGVSHVLVDEIHERGMNEDFLLIVLKNLLSRRPDLKLVLMSATLNAELFSEYFDGAPTTHIPGFTHPVEKYFLEQVLQTTGHYLTPLNQVDDYGEDKQWKMAKQLRGRSRKTSVNAIAEAAMADCDISKYSYRVRDSLGCWNPESMGFNTIEKLLCHICKNERDGAVLVFLTGWEDISAVLEKVRSNPVLGDPSKVLLLGCHGSMATAEQKLIFGSPPPGVRKIVFATNMAETSITINDVVFVIDCGKAKETSYDSLNNTPCLLPQWISKASARQRRGRAGRVQPGVCYHLYPQAVHDAFDDYQLPELLRTPLQSLCLQIKSLGLGSIEEFLSKALQPPEYRSVHNAVELLKTMGALDDKEELTDLGRHLSNLPVEPRLGKMLLMAAIFRCLDPVLTIAAGLTTRDPFVFPMDKKDEASNAKFRFCRSLYSDHLGLVKAFDGWRTAMDQGTATDYCWNNFLSFQTLQRMQSLRKQFQGQLLDAGFDVAQCNDFTQDPDLVRSVICSGMYPGVASAVVKSKSTVFKTKEDGQVNVNQNSVNGRDQKLFYPWLVYNEKVKTSSVNIRDSTGVSDAILLLFGGKVKKGYEPGQLLMQDGFLEFFLPRDLATTILMLREELDSLVKRKLANPGMDLQDDENLLFESVRQLLRGDQCEGTFVYGRKAATVQMATKAESQGDFKSVLQNMVQRGGKHPPPKYKTKEAPHGGYQSTVQTKGRSFIGKPASSKRQAEKNASRIALEALYNYNLASQENETQAPVARNGSSRKEKMRSKEAALELFNRSKRLKGKKQSGRTRKATVSV